ncbi:MAG: hypothetical protein AAGA56_02080 [Myxococcota bacterium]
MVREEFARRFARHARRIRQRLMLRIALYGVAAGATLGTVAVALSWQGGQAIGLRAMFAFGALLSGAAAGTMLHHRWTDTDIALYLDRKWRETVVTALETDSASAAGRAVLAKGVAALGEPVDLPPVWRRGHLSLVAVMPLGFMVALPSPVTPVVPALPGTENVQVTTVSLDAVMALAELPGTEAERARLNQLVREAKALRQRLHDGMPRREAQADLAQLRAAVATERNRFGTGEERRGLEAALSVLNEHPGVSRVRRALGDRDLTALDEEMAQLANRLERRARREAVEALEDAARAADEAGAPDVAEELRNQGRRVGRRAAQSQALRALAEAMGEGLGDDARRALRDAERSGATTDQRRLADALSQALERLTDGERQRLAERMREMARDFDPAPAQTTQRMADDLLGTPDELADRLRSLAQPPPSPGAERQRRLADAERELGAVPLPGDSSRPPGPSGPLAPPGPPAPPGVSRGGGPGQHDGFSKPLDGESVRAHTRSPLSPGALNPDVSRGRAPGRAGETADQAGTGRLGQIEPARVRSVDGGHIPEEYREQVGRYFQP